MMFLARIVPGRVPEVFTLTGALFIQPKSWAFCSYRQGSCAIAATAGQAMFEARRELRRGQMLAHVERRIQESQSEFTQLMQRPK